MGAGATRLNEQSSKSQWVLRSNRLPLKHSHHEPNQQQQRGNNNNKSNSGLRSSTPRVHPRKQSSPPKSQSQQSQSQSQSQQSQAQSDSQTPEESSTQGNGKSGSQGSGSKGQGSQGSGGKAQTSQQGENGGQSSEGSGSKEGQGGSKSGSGSKPGSQSGSSRAGSSGPGNSGGQQQGSNQSPSSQNDGDSKGGSGQQSDGQRGTGGQGDRGGGPAEGGASSGPESPKDESTKPVTTRADEPENPGGDTVAPKNQPQSDLFLRKLDEALQDDAKAKDLERDTGVSREQLEQFAKKYEKMKSAPAGPGRDIKVKPGEQTAAQQPSPNLPGLGSSVSFSTAARRKSGSAPQDQLRDNNEAIRLTPPAEFRGRLEGYKNKLMKVAAPTPKRPAAPSTRKGQ